MIGLNGLDLFVSFWGNAKKKINKEIKIWSADYFSRPFLAIIGQVIIHDLIYNASKEQWVNGRMYDPGREIWANLKVKAVNEERAIAEGSKFFFSKTVVWEKIY
ncbi:MAG: hypothetical protein R6U46_09645 [Marinilabilia sp.]